MKENYKKYFDENGETGILKQEPPIVSIYVKSLIIASKLTNSQTC